MNPSIWGPLIWPIIYQVYLKSVDPCPYKLKIFTYLLADLLPCIICSRNFYAFLNINLETVTLNTLEDRLQFCWAMKAQSNLITNKTNLNIDDFRKRNLIWTKFACNNIYFDAFSIINKHITPEKRKKFEKLCSLIKEFDASFPIECAKVPPNGLITPVSSNAQNTKLL